MSEQNAITTLWEAIGHHAAQVAQTGDLAPGEKLMAAMQAVEAQLASASPVQAEPAGYFEMKSSYGPYVEVAYKSEDAIPLYAHPPSGKDAELLDWLQSQAGITLHEPVKAPGAISESKSWLITNAFGDELGSGATLREAIRAAISAEVVVVK